MATECGHIRILVDTGFLEWRWARGATPPRLVPAMHKVVEKDGVDRVVPGAWLEVWACPVCGWALSPESYYTEEGRL